MNRLIASLGKRGSYDAESLKSLYRKLALKLHPDRSGRGPEAFLELQKEFEEAMAGLGNRSKSPAPARVPGYHAALERYLSQIAEDNMIHTLASGPAREALDHLINSIGGEGEVRALFVEYRAVFHEQFESLLRYPSIRTAFQCLHKALWYRVSFAKTSDPVADELCRTYLSETEALLKRSGRIKAESAQREIAVMAKIIRFIRGKE
jgi:hypothetical protein